MCTPPSFGTPKAFAIAICRAAEISCGQPTILIPKPLGRIPELSCRSSLPGWTRRRFGRWCTTTRGVFTDSADQPRHQAGELRGLREREQGSLPIACEVLGEHRFQLSACNLVT